VEASLDVVVSGHLCLDLLPKMGHVPLAALSSPGKLFEVGPMGFSTGGAVSNTGLALHRLGANVRLMASVGNDLLGRAILDFINARDPALTECVDVKEGASSYTLVLTPEQVDRIFFQYAGTNATFGAGDVDYTLVAKAKLFHLGYPPLLPRLIANDGDELVTLFQKARAAGAITSMDMTLPDPSGVGGRVDWRKVLERTLAHVDIFIPSLGEILFMLRRSDYDRWHDRHQEFVTWAYLDAFSDELLRLGSSAVVGFKLGPYGMYLRAAGADRIGRLAGLPLEPSEWIDKKFWHPAFQVDVVGTTGAGDSAYAGLLVAMLKGYGAEDAARWACAVGACNVEAADSTSGVQSWESTQRRLESGWQTSANQLI
jgi:sugar/nucleoside kinase (ribokinase family)